MTQVVTPGLFSSHLLPECESVDRDLFTHVGSVSEIFGNELVLDCLDGIHRCYTLPKAISVNEVTLGEPVIVTAHVEDGLALIDSIHNYDFDLEGPALYRVK